MQPSYPAAPTDLQAAYLAGLFDGCGTVIGSEASGRFIVRVKITSLSRPPLDKAQAVYGGDVRPQENGSAAGGPIGYVLAWPNQEEAHKFVEAITPYTVRWKAQLDLAKQWLEFQVMHRYEEDDYLAKLRDAFGQKT